MSTSTVCANPGWSNTSPPHAYFQRASKVNASTASRSDKPNRRCNTITVATIWGATLRRPRSENKSANISSGNNRCPSRCNTDQIELSATRPSHAAADLRRRSPCFGANPTVIQNASTHARERHQPP